jgi:hypothetical protein
MAESKSSGFAEEKESKETEGKDAAEDEEREFTIVPQETLGSPVSSRKGLSLDLSLAAAATKQRECSKAISAEDEIEMNAFAPVRILFDLPDGTQVEKEFQMGQTVEVLKAFLFFEIGMPMGEQRLFLDSGVGPLMDPLSLSDYPIDNQDEVVIRVVGEMDDVGAKK